MRKGFYNAPMQKLGILIIAVGLSLFGGVSAWASEAQLDEALKPLQSAKALKASVHRTLNLALLDTEKKETGILTVSGGNMRLEISQPVKSLLVLKGRDVWLEVHPDPEIGGELQVSRGRLNKSKDSKIFMGLLGGEPWKTHFSLKETKKSADGIVYLLEPKKDLPDFKSVRVMMDSQNKKLGSIEYTDELNNKTTYAFNSLELLKSVTSKTFQYTPPKSVRVMELN